MQCDHAVQLRTCCICGCTVHLFRRLATCSNSEKNHQLSGLQECLEFQLLVFQWVWSHVDDDNEAVCKLACDPDEFVCRFPRDSLSNLQLVFGVNCVVIFFVALKLLSFSLSYLLTARNGSVFFLGPCQVLVVQSFAFSFRLSKVWSLIEWLLRSFCN